MAKHATPRQLHIALCHPDLGIGGAKQLVVDAAMKLTAVAHAVHIFTAHHDPQHCFEETIAGKFPVTVYGDFLPRNIFNRLSAVCAYIRCFYLAICMVFFWPAFDLVMVDQVSVVVPVLKLKQPSKVLLLSESQKWNFETRNPIPLSMFLTKQTDFHPYYTIIP